MAYLIDLDERTAWYIKKYLLNPIFLFACDDTNQRIIANGNIIAGIEAKE